MEKEIKKIRRAMGIRIKKLPRDIAVVSISSIVSKRLNLIYREENRSTNVLSFRYGKEYGEILVCPEVVRKEAKAQKNSYEHQMTWMILHGMLHLAGLHHESSKASARLAEKLEGKILRKLYPNKQSANL